MSISSKQLLLALLISCYVIDFFSSKSKILLGCTERGSCSMQRNITLNEVKRALTWSLASINSPHTLLVRLANNSVSTQDFTVMGFHWLQDPCSFQRGGSFCTEADIRGPTVPEKLGHYQNDSVSLKKGPHTGYLTRDCPRLMLRFWSESSFFFFPSLQT